jgi:hypothetical protein
MPHRQDGAFPGTSPATRCQENPSHGDGGIFTNTYQGHHQKKSQIPVGRIHEADWLIAAGTA